ncbi:MAG: ABC transporter permease [Bacilli bacterium]
MGNKFKFLTKYSFMKKIKNKSFLIANLIVAIIVIGLANIDTIVTYFGGDFDDNIKINVIDNTNNYKLIEDNLNDIKNFLTDSKVIIKNETRTLKKAKEDIKGTKKILLVINSSDENVFDIEFISDSYVDTITYQAITSALNNTKVSIAMKNANIDPTVLSNISKEVKVKRTFLNEEKTEKGEKSSMILGVASIIIVLPCFMLIIFLVQMIGAEVNEEKSTRGMEIIIGNVSPKVHFFSKILSSNLFVLLQGFLLLCYGGIGLIIRKITTSSGVIDKVSSNFDVNVVLNILKDSDIIDRLGYIIPLALILIILSFLAYSLLAGILASMTTNMENFQQLQTPIMIVSIIGYYLILISTAFPGALFMKIMSVIPFISISLAPSLLLTGEIGVVIMIIAIVIIALTDYLLLKYGLKIYKAGILNYSETGLWKKMFKAVKEK